MDWSIFSRWEWLVIEIAVLALAVFELISVNRAIRRDRAHKAEGDHESIASRNR